jgi:hypothetical protein
MATKTEKRWVVELNEPLLGRLREFHRLSNLPGTEQETARELLDVALAQSGERGLIHAARQRAYKQAAQAAWKAFGGLAAQLSEVFAASLARDD